MIDLKTLRNGEAFLVLEAAPRGTSGILFAVDDRREVSVQKFWKEFKWSPLLRRLIFLMKVPIIVSLDPAVAYTVVLPATLNRRKSEGPIDAVALENFLAQTIQKALNTYRDEAALALGVDSLDTILTQSRAVRFIADGKRIENPIGSEAKKLEVLLEHMFSPREFFDRLNGMVEEGIDFFLTDRAKSELLLLGQGEYAPLTHLHFPDKKEGVFWRVRPHDSDGYIERGRVPLSGKIFYAAISSRWGVSENNAALLYDRYLGNDMSGHAYRHFDQTVKVAVGALFDTFQKKKFSGPVFLKGGPEMPFALPQRKAGMLISRISLPNLLEWRGFKLRKSLWPGNRPPLTHYLAPFVEFYYDKSNRHINHWLKRRIHWIA